MANSVEQVLILLRDMAELWNLKKHEMFLSLKRDLALVHFLLSSFTKHYFTTSTHFINFQTHLTFFFLACIQATQVAHVVEEWVDQALHEKKEKESKRYTAQRTQAQTDKKLKETLSKLSECDKAKKNVEALIESTGRQTQ